MKRKTQPIWIGFEPFEGKVRLTYRLSSSPDGKPGATGRSLDGTHGSQQTSWFGARPLTLAHTSIALLNSQFQPLVMPSSASDDDDERDEISEPPRSAFGAVQLSDDGYAPCCNLLHRSSSENGIDHGHDRSANRN